MREGRASRTAEQNALFRALEAARPQSARVCDDPLARSFLGWPYNLAAAAGSVPGAGAFVPWFIDRRWPGVRTSVVARTRLIDQTIDARLADATIEQVVLLGAGFDSRAYRLERLRARHVFEVDHPATQAAKQQVLRRALGALPAHVRFVPVDFAHDDLGAAMTAAGYRTSTRSFLLWEGVTNYLSEPAVDATLRWCGGAAPGSGLLFTYVHRDMLTRPHLFAGTDNLFAALDRAGEHFTYGIEPAELPGLLARHGLVLESDVGAAEYRARAYGDAARRMRGHEFYRVALARVGERPAA